MGVAHGTPFNFWRLHCLRPSRCHSVCVCATRVYLCSLPACVCATRVYLCSLPGMRCPAPPGAGAGRCCGVLWGAVGCGATRPSSCSHFAHSPAASPAPCGAPSRLAVQFCSESPAPGRAEEGGIACTGGLRSESGDRQRRPHQDRSSVEPITSGGPCVGTFLLTCAMAPGAACSATFPSVVPLVPLVCVGAWGGRAPGSRRGCLCPPPASAPSADGCPPPRPPSRASVTVCPWPFRTC